MEMEDPGIDPGTSRMQSERSTIWANPPDMTVGICIPVKKIQRYYKFMILD